MSSQRFRFENQLCRNKAEEMGKDKKATNKGKDKEVKLNTVV